MVYRGTTRFWAKIPVFGGFPGPQNRAFFGPKSGPEPGFGSRASLGRFSGRCDSGKCAFSKPWVLGVQASEMLFRVLFCVVLFSCVEKFRERSRREEIEDTKQWDAVMKTAGP